jgi:hypothetical protein
MSERGCALIAGLGLGLIFANLCPAPSGRWVFMVPGVAIGLVFAFVIPWLKFRYRIERSDRARGGQA